MTLSTSLKLAALALTLVISTTGGAFASQYAVVNTDSDVLSQPIGTGLQVNWVEEDDQVKVIKCVGNPQSLVGAWCKIKIPGQDGWVRSSALNFSLVPQPQPFPQPQPVPPNGQVCVAGPNGSFCVTI